MTTNNYNLSLTFHWQAEENKESGTYLFIYLWPNSLTNSGTSSSAGVTAVVLGFETEAAHRSQQRPEP